MYMIHAICIQKDSYTFVSTEKFRGKEVRSEGDNGTDAWMLSTATSSTV